SPLCVLLLPLVERSISHSPLVSVSTEGAEERLPSEQRGPAVTSGSPRTRCSLGSRSSAPSVETETSGE
ncbi:MAG: hypothetical protein AAF488_16495, partial [Planctomycetota bacterium]